MHVITITFAAPVAPVHGAIAPICRMFQPQGCAADHPNMEGTYYDTNVDGRGDLVTSFDQYIEQQVAHPGLVAALKQAVRTGEYTIKEADEKAALYAAELSPALKDQGFTIVVDKPDDEAVVKTAAEAEA